VLDQTSQRNKYSLEVRLVVRAGEQAIIDYLPEYRISNLHLTCYCELDQNFTNSLSKLQRVTFGFIKNEAQFLV
jgi:hypothetical protein